MHDTTGSNLAAAAPACYKFLYEIENHSARPILSSQGGRCARARARRPHRRRRQCRSHIEENHERL